MGVLYYVVVFIFVVVCLLLIGIILLQSSKTGGMGSALAGNSALSSAFGSEGADKLLVKITTIFAVLFMSLSILLNVLSSPQETGKLPSNNSVLQGDSNINQELLEKDLNIQIEDSTQQ